MTKREKEQERLADLFRTLKNSGLYTRGVRDLTEKEERKLNHLSEIFIKTGQHGDLMDYLSLLCKERGMEG